MINERIYEHSNQDLRQTIHRETAVPRIFYKLESKVVLLTESHQKQHQMDSQQQLDQW